MSHPAVGQPNNPSQTQRVSPHSTPLEHCLYADRKLVIVKFGHHLSTRDIERYAILLKADPQFHADFSEIVDLTAVQEVEIEGDDFMKLADEVDPFAPEARRAFVAQSPLQQHAARMHKILRVNRNFEIFSSVAAAERWIQS